MRMKNLFSAALACVAIVSSFAWGQTWTTSTIQNVNGLDYELWNQNNKGTVSMKITGGSTNPNGGTFEATWNGTENILTRAGKKWGSSSTTTAKSVGNISIDFAATWTSGDNVKMLGVYGWAYYPSGSEPSGFSNQIEYYIIQDRGSYNPASGATNSQKKGSGTIDGIQYDFYVGDRINQPMLTGNGTFKQYFSVPTNTSSHRQKGIISVSKHFEAWDKAGMKMMDCPLYEVAMKVESYTGSPNGQGSANVTRNILTLGGSGNVDPPLNEFALNTTVSPAAAGTITKSPSAAYYAPNATVQLTATANEGWKFIGWEGAATGSSNTASVSITDKDLSVTAKFELVGESTTNLIKDGNFPSSGVITAGDDASWKLGQGENWGNSAATSSVAGGTATINVATIGTESYQPQLVQYGLALEKGMKYKLTFNASAASARVIEASFQQSVDPWGSYASKEFNLTTSTAEYVYIFEMTDASDPEAQFAFNLGQATGDVKISDVKLVYTSITKLTPRGNNVLAANNSSLVSLNGRVLNVSPVYGSKLQVRVIDVNGKVKASFSAANEATFSLSNIPAGLYFLDVKGAGLNQFKSIVLQ